MPVKKTVTNNAPFLQPINGGITAPKGFIASAAEAGIKASGGNDIALLYSETPCAAAGAFTANNVRASSVDWCEGILPSTGIHAVFCNAGNANACTGKRGEKDTRSIAKAIARTYGGGPESALVAATGVIGHFLPMKAILPKIAVLWKTASRRGGSDFARAIMTTDTRVKECACNVVLRKGTCTIGGCAKGSGMIHPNMATMLCFITADVAVSVKLLNAMVKRAIDRTFNNLTVDGDTSTNDMALALANGCSGVSVDEGEDARRFEEGLYAVCTTLCKKIAEDGEGATKRLEIAVTGAKTYEDAKLAAKAIANSNLVKTAMFGSDPNWGRIVCAVGYSGARFSRARLSVDLCGIPVFLAMRPISFPQKALHKKLKAKVVTIAVDLGLGEHEAVAHTCDFSYDYVKINAEYHT
jgi:glutamate N-acetyltransferase / amino-acid N-acetyltransferase